MIPSEIKFDGNATPPQFTDNGDQVIEKGTQIRVKIKGIRGEVGQMYAIATIKEVSVQGFGVKCIHNQLLTLCFPRTTLGKIVPSILTND